MEGLSAEGTCGPKPGEHKLEAVYTEGYGPYLQDLRNSFGNPRNAQRASNYREQKPARVINKCKHNASRTSEALQRYRDS